jgi:hypothetical protein
MRGQTKGLYVVLCFDFDPSQIQALRSELMLRPNVMRHNLTLLPDNYVVPVRIKEAKEEEVAEEPAEPKVRVARKVKAIPVESTPSEPVASVEESVIASESAPASVLEQETTEPESEGGLSKKGKHKSLDEGLDKILSDLSSI